MVMTECNLSDYDSFCYTHQSYECRKKEMNMMTTEKQKMCETVYELGDYVCALVEAKRKVNEAEKKVPPYIPVGKPEDYYAIELSEYKQACWDFYTKLETFFTKT